MKCPRCNAEFGEPRLIAPMEAIRGFAHREPPYAKEAECIIYLKGEYRCTKCGHKLNEREAYLQHA